jgi:branched-subunit amino acid ABC-type transport system permease component
MSVGSNTGSNPVVPFLLGTAVGGLAGAVVGTLLSGHATHLVATILEIVDRRDDQNKRRPKFEFMLQ